MATWGAENWDAKPSREPERPPPRLSLWQRFLGLLFLAALLAGGVAGYVALGRHSTLQGTLPLPKSLRTTSTAHNELLILGRALDELCVEAEAWLRVPTRKSRATSMRLHDRLGRLNRVGRELEPQVTREETRVLMAYRNAVRLLDEYLDGIAAPQGRPEPSLVRAARTQVGRGLRLARGESIDDLIVTGLQKALPRPGGKKPAAATKDVRRASDDLRLLGD